MKSLRKGPGGGPGIEKPDRAEGAGLDADLAPETALRLDHRKLAGLELHEGARAARGARLAARARLAAFGIDVEHGTHGKPLLTTGLDERAARTVTVNAVGRC